MIVRYNQLSSLDTPVLTLCNPGSVYRNGVLSNMVGVLTDTEAEEIVFNFNATSELNFRVNKVIREDPEENAYVQRMYQAVQNRRLVFVEDIGYFVISNIDDGFDGVKQYKDVKAKSIDAELSQKVIPYIEDGTYPFMTDATNQNRGIFEIIVESLSPSHLPLLLLLSRPLRLRRAMWYLSQRTQPTTMARMCLIGWLQSSGLSPLLPLATVL